jgi:hypothetical protein
MPKVVSDAIGKVTSIKEQKQKKCLSIRRHHGGAAAFSLAFGPHGHNVTGTRTFQTFPQRNSKGFCSGRAVEYGGTRRGRNHQHFHRQTIEWDASLPTARPTNYFKSYGILPTIMRTLSQMSKCGSTKLVKNRASMARTFPVSMERTTQPVP